MTLSSIQVGHCRSTLESLLSGLPAMLTEIFAARGVNVEVAPDVRTAVPASDESVSVGLLADPDTELAAAFLEASAQGSPGRLVLVLPDLAGSLFCHPALARFATRYCVVGDGGGRVFVVAARAPVRLDLVHNTFGWPSMPARLLPAVFASAEAETLSLDKALGIEVALSTGLAVPRSRVWRAGESIETKQLARQWNDWARRAGLRDVVLKPAGRSGASGIQSISVSRPELGARAIHRFLKRGENVLLQEALCGDSFVSQNGSENRISAVRCYLLRRSHGRYETHGVGVTVVPPDADFGASGCVVTARELQQFDARLPAAAARVAAAFADRVEQECGAMHIPTQIAVDLLPVGDEPYFLELDTGGVGLGDCQQAFPALADALVERAKANQDHRELGRCSWAELMPVAESRNHAETCALAVNLCLNRGAHERAVDLLDAALAMAPETPSLLHNRALLALSRQDVGEAARDLRAWLEIEPESPAAIDFISQLGLRVESTRREEVA